MNIYDLLRMRGQLPAHMGGALPQPMNAPPGPQMGPQPIMGGNSPNPALGAVPFPGQQWKSAGPLAPQQAAPPKGRGFLGAIDDVFGGPDMKNLTPEQRKAARRKGLLAFGAQMLTATDPRGNRAQGLSALGQGVMAAQGGYGQGIEQGMAQNQAQQEAHMWAQLQPQPGENIQQTYARLQAMFAAAMQAGNPRFAQMVAGVLQTLPSLMKDKTADAPKTPWEAKGFATKEDLLAFLREETNATQRPFAPRGDGGDEPYRNPYLGALGTRMDNLRAEIVSMEAGKGPSEASRALRTELRGLDREFKGLMQNIPGAPPVDEAPINPVTGTPFAKRRSPGNPFQ